MYMLKRSAAATLLLFLTAFSFAGPSPVRAEMTLKQGLAWRDHGANTLITTLHVEASDRSKMRAILAKDGVARMERLKAQGILRRYRILFSRYADSNWDAMLVLDFASDKALASWKAVEADSPAGLPPDAAKLAKDVQTQLVDMVLGDTIPSKPGDPAPVFLAVPYDVIVSNDDYIRYAHGYIGPQTKEWVKAGIVGTYDLYVSRFPVGRSWSSMVFYAYKGDAGLAQRDAVSQTAHDRLMQNESWKTWNDGKMKLRSERAPVIADILN
jgi:DNA-binding Lrp family transcriptional regulator